MTTLRDLVQPFVPSLRSVIVFFFVVYIPLYLFSITFFGRRTRRSPFVFPSLLKGSAGEPEGPADKRQRDAVLRQYFSPKRVPARVDVIVVGSGPAGLVTAALLARSGVRVLVLEQGPAAGGLQDDENGGRQFEMEQHWPVAPNTVLRMMLDQVTNGQVRWEAVEPDFDAVCVFRDGAFRHRTTVTKGAEVFQRRLIDSFPHEAGAIRKYFALLAAADAAWWVPLWAKLFPSSLVLLLQRLGILRLLSPFFRLARRSLQEVLDELTACDELKTILAYGALMRGVLPSQESFVAHAARTKALLDEGGFYPRGGFEELAYRMGALIEAAKGKVLVRAEVAQLLTDGRRVTGVRVRTDGKAVDVSARTVVLSEGLAGAHGLLPAELRPKAAWLADLERLAQRPQQGATFHCHFWVSGQPLAALRSQNMALCFKAAGRSDEQALEEWLRCPAEVAGRRLPPFAAVAVPSMKDPTWTRRAGDAAGLLVIISFPGAAAWAAPLRADAATRQRLFDGLWAALCRVQPGLEAQRVGDTALRVEAAAPQRQQPTEAPERFAGRLQHRLRPDCGVRGLLLAGGGLTTGGATGELQGALLCAAHYLNRNLAAELDKMAAGAVAKRATRIPKRLLEFDE